MTKQVLKPGNLYGEVGMDIDDLNRPSQCEVSCVWGGLKAGKKGNYFRVCRRGAKPTRARKNVRRKNRATNGNS